MNRKWWLAGGGLLALVVVVVGVWFLFFRDDAPDEVSIGAANEQLDADLAAAADETTTTAAPDDVDDPAEGADPAEATTSTAAADEPAPPPEGVDGEWVIDDEIGEFDFETASGSFAGFRVDEELTIGAVTAVGRSGGVTGSLRIEDGSLVTTTVEVDMTTIVSNDSRRENAIRGAISASEFPTATFTLTDPVDVSGLEVGGDPVAFTVQGELTVAGVTNPTTWELQANVRADGFGVVTGSTEIVWEDFGVTPPSAPIVVSVADEGIVEFQLIVARGR